MAGSTTSKIASVVLMYWVISITMVFANKYLLGTKSTKYDISIFVAWIQCFVTVGVILLLQFISRLFGLNMAAKGSKFRIEPSYPLRATLSSQILLMTCSFMGMLIFNNLCLRQVSIAFYQVARSLTLIFVVLLSVIILAQNVSWRILMCCIVIAGGFLLGVDQEKLAGTLSHLGVIFGVLTSLFIALNGIFTKRALEVVERDSVKLTFYNNLNACVVFIPFLLATGQFQAVVESGKLYDLYFWTCLVISGIFGFLIAWISAVQIDLTSPVTHHISANSKAVIQTLLAVIYFKESKQWLWWFSILMIVGGATSYALIRIREDKTEREAKEAKSQNGELEISDGKKVETV